jgi:flavodoxin
MPMLHRSVILVCHSKHHGNTRRVAQVMAEELGATVVEPSAVSSNQLTAYDLIGLGSGIYYGRHDPGLLKLAESLVPDQQRVFIFSTSGNILFGRFFHGALRRRLKARGCRIVGEFQCPGWDTFGPLAWIGGIHRHRPNEDDLERARRFARSLTQPHGLG